MILTPTRPSLMGSLMEAVPVSREKNTRGTMSIFKSRRKRSPIQLRLRLASLKRSPKTAPTANPIRIHPSSPIRRPSAMTLSSIRASRGDLDPLPVSVRQNGSIMPDVPNPSVALHLLSVPGTTHAEKRSAEKNGPPGSAPRRATLILFGVRRASWHTIGSPKDVHLPPHPPKGTQGWLSFEA